MITLKKSFELANYFSSLEREAARYLSVPCAVKVTEKHFRSKSYSAAEDEIVEQPRSISLDERITNNILIEFYEFIVGEICRLNIAIEKAKNSGEVSYDTLIANNASKYSLIACLEQLAGLKASEIKKEGYAYKFNDTGDQVRYTYPLEIVKTIDFDRNLVKKKLAALRKETEETSEKIELLKLELKADFDTILTRGESFEDAVLTFMENR